MSDIGSRFKRHIAVRYPKGWRRKRRKPAGTALTVKPHIEEPPSSRHLSSDISHPRHPTTPRQYSTSSEPHRTSVFEIPDNGDDDSRSETDIHELHDLREEGHNVTDEELFQHSDSEDEERNTEQQDPSHKCKVENVMLQRHVLSALCLGIGSSRLTAKQYILSRALTNHEGKYQKRAGYPCYTTLSTKILPIMRRFVYVPTILQHMTVNSNLAGAPQQSCSTTGEIVPLLKKVKLILPSSWAKKDINTISYFTSNASNLVHGSRRCPIIYPFDIDNTPILQYRSLCFRANILESVSRSGTVWISESNFQDAKEIEVILHPPPRHKRTILTSLGVEDRIEDGHQTIAVKGNVTSTTFQEQSETDLIYGDVVSVLHIPDCPSHFKVLLVHRMSQTRGLPRQLIIIRNTTCASDNISFRCKRISAISSTAAEPERAVPLSHDRTYGRLADGRRYTVYRVIIYSDDFEQFTRKKGSAGGCYILPVRLPLQNRRGKGAVRVISLTPPGISTNKIISSIIPDIVSATKDGIDAVDYLGMRITVFIEVIGYIGDYVAVRHVLDLTGPKGVAPCPLCTFLKGSKVGAKTSEYAYSVTSHSGHASFRRDKRRMHLLKRNCRNSTDLQQFGLQDITIEEASKLPLHALSDALEKVRDDIPKTEHGKPVVSGIFDPYLSTLVAPDHLLTGLGEDLINANMRLLAKPRRIIAETLMQHALIANGLATEPHLYNHDKLHLHSLSISTMFNVILVAPWSIYYSMMYKSDGTRNASKMPTITGCVDLLFKYQKLVSDTLFFPTCNVDGKKSVVEFNKTGNESRLNYLKTKCAEYIQAVDSVCTENALAKKELDKPNIHRLLELYNHTIPLVGHVRQVQELLFESAHQPLKRGLQKSNHRDAQLTAMDMMLANDWKSRLGQILRGCGISHSTELSDTQCIKLKQLLCGDTSIQSIADRDGRIAGRIRECFKSPAVDHLISVAHDHEAVPARHWIPFEVRKKDIFNYSPINNTNAAIKYLSTLYQQHIDGGGTLRRVMYAKYAQEETASTSVSTAKGKLPKTGAHLLKRSDVIQAATQNIPSSTQPVIMLTTQEDFIDCRSIPSCSRRFWLVLDVVLLSKPNQEHENTITKQSMFVVVWPIDINNNLSSPTSGHYNTYSVIKKDTLFILPLKRSVRKTMPLHVCNWNETATCRVIPHGQFCHHSGSIADGHPFLLFGSVEGFPSRDG